MIEREEILKIIAERHRLILDSDDPILSIFAISDVLYEKLNGRILEIHASESQRLLEGVRGIVKEGRYDFGRGIESLLHVLKNENMKHSVEIYNTTKQHIEAIEILTLEAKRAVSLGWIAFGLTISLTLFLLTGSIYSQ